VSAREGAPSYVNRRCVLSRAVHKCACPLPKVGFHLITGCTEMYATGLFSMSIRNWRLFLQHSHGAPAVRDRSRRLSIYFIISPDAGVYPRYGVATIGIPAAARSSKPRSVCPHEMDRFGFRRGRNCGYDRLVTVCISSLLPRLKFLTSLK